MTEELKINICYVDEDGNEYYELPAQKKKRKLKRRGYMHNNKINCPNICKYCAYTSWKGRDFLAHMKRHEESRTEHIEVEL